MIRPISILVLALGLCYGGLCSAEDERGAEFTSEPFERGLNIPITLTTTTATAIDSYSQILQSWTVANCSGSVGSNYASGSGTPFPVSTGTSTIYISTASGTFCNTGSLNRSFSINNPGSVLTNAGACSASSGCVTVNCANTSTVSSVTSTLTLTCP